MLTSVPTDSIAGRALEPLVGSRAEQCAFEPQTGLLTLTFYAGQKLRLVVGIGPRVVGYGLASRSPRAKANATQPLVAALRAHIDGHRVRGVAWLDGQLWLTVGGDGVTARVAMRAGRRGEVRVIDVDGRTVIAWPISNADDRASAAEQVAPASFDDAAALAHAGDAMVEQADRLGLDASTVVLRRAMQRAADQLTRREAAVAGDLARLEDVARLQKIGRLLLAQGAKIRRGARTATLDDWEDGGTVDIALDPAHPAKAQAEGFFSKARRYQRGRAAMLARLETTRAQLSRLRDLQGEFDSTTIDATSIEQWAQRVREAGIRVPQAQTSGAVARERPSRRPFHTYVGANGGKILVGRGGADNDELIRRYARPHDLWLHTKGVHGAHVVVPLEKNTTCPSELLVDAATLAAHHSDARGETTCEVSYVERRHVRKPRGAPPGAVTLDQEKVLVLRVEPDRVARLLAARDETA